MLEVIKRQLNIIENSCHHHDHRRHTGDQHPHRRGHQHSNSHQHHGPPTWLQQQQQQLFKSTASKRSPTALGPSEISVASRALWSINNSFAFTRKLFASYVIIIMLLGTCIDARVFPSNTGLNSLSAPHRTARSPEAAPQGVDSTGHVSSHSTNTLPSISPSSPSLPPSTDNIPGVEKAQQPANPADQDGGGSNLIPDSATKAQLVSILISALERLKVMDDSGTSCFRLERIVHKLADNQTSSPSSSSSSSSSVQNIHEVYLYFQEIPQRATHSSLNVNSTGKTMQTAGDNRSNASVLPNSCVSDPFIQVAGATVGSKEESDDGGEEQNATVVGSGDTTAHTGVYGILQSGKLSRTQIVVISTCSAIIGMFFLVAAILRIRNYIKRARMEQALAKRPKFRSCSVALRGAAQSMEQLRRDSLASKSSHQNSVSTKGSNGSQTNGSSRENSSASSPRHDPDTAPLLLLARAHQVNEMTSPTESHSSLQYIDEDLPGPNKKKAIPPSTLLRNGQQDYIMAYRQFQGLSLERSSSQKSQVKTSPNNIEAMRSFRQNGPVPKGKTEDTLSPSYLIGNEFYPSVGNGQNTAGVLQRGPSDKKQNGRTRRSPDKSPNGYTPLSRVDTDSDRPAPKGERIQGRPNCSDEATVERKVEKCGTDLLWKNSSCEQNGIIPGTLDSEVRQVVAQNGQLQNDSVNKETAGKIDHEHVGPKEISETGTAKQTVDDKDLLSPLSDVSYFGLSQSDSSLTSVSNQGKEFSGQEEYHSPDSSVELARSCNEITSTGFQDDCDISVAEINDVTVNEVCGSKTESDTVSAHNSPKSPAEILNLPRSSRSGPAVAANNKESIFKLLTDDNSGKELKMQSSHSQPSVDSGINIHSDLDNCARGNPAGEEISPTSFGPFLTPSTPVRTEQVMCNSGAAETSRSLTPSLQVNDTSQKPNKEVHTLTGKSEPFLQKHGEDQSPPAQSTVLSQGSSNVISGVHTSPEQSGHSSTESSGDNTLSTNSVREDDTLNTSIPTNLLPNDPNSTLSTIQECQGDETNCGATKTQCGLVLPPSQLKEEDHMNEIYSSDMNVRHSKTDVPSTGSDSPALNNNEVYHSTSGRPLAKSSYNQVVNSSTYL